MTREHETSLSYLHSLVSDVFNLLEVGLLIRIEHQLLEVQSSQPVLTHSLALAPLPQHSPMRCRCWTGGCPCPWGQGIKSMPMRSSARQRKRSSRRPCRPHKSSCRGRRPWIVRPRRTRRSPQFPMRRHERRRSRWPLRARRHASTSPLQTSVRGGGGRSNIADRGRDAIPTTTIAITITTVAVPIRPYNVAAAPAAVPAGDH